MSLLLDWKCSICFLKEDNIFPVGEGVFLEVLAHSKHIREKNYFSLEKLKTLTEKFIKSIYILYTTFSDRFNIRLEHHGHDSPFISDYTVAYQASQHTIFTQLKICPVWFDIVLPTEHEDYLPLPSRAD